MSAALRQRLASGASSAARRGLGQNASASGDNGNLHEGRNALGGLKMTCLRSYSPVGTAQRSARRGAAIHAKIRL